MAVSTQACSKVGCHCPDTSVANTTANWLVRDIEQVRKTKNILLFIGDGMTTNMVTAARLIGHKTVNGRYQSTLALDKFPTM